MKTFRFLGMAFLAMVLCVNLTACSDDEENEPSNGGSPSVTGAKPSSFTWNDGRSFKMFYDKQQRLSKVEYYTESGFIDRTTYFEYNDNNIIETTTYPDGSKDNSIMVYTLNSEGLIVNATIVRIDENGQEYSNPEDTEQYAYNDNQQLIGIQDYEYDYIYDTDITWENENIITTKGNDRGAIFTTNYEYTSIPSSKGFFVFYDDVLIDVFSDVDNSNLLANLGYFGKVPQNLLASVTYIDPTGKTDASSLSYQFGKDGYVTKVSGTYGENGWSAEITWD